jgi:uncharacterized protein YyaL (SSP411 family)
MLASFAEAGIVLDRPDYLEAARRNARFVLSNLLRDGLLLEHIKTVSPSTTPIWKTMRS